MADAAKPAAAGRNLCLQHLAHARAKRQIGVADDPLGNPARPVAARGAHRGDAIDKLDLADRRHLRRAGPAVHRSAFEEDRGDDVVALSGIGAGADVFE